MACKPQDETNLSKLLAAGLAGAFVMAAGITVPTSTRANTPSVTAQSAAQPSALDKRLASLRATVTEAGKIPPRPILLAWDNSNIANP